MKNYIVIAVLAFVGSHSLCAQSQPTQHFNAPFPVDNRSLSGEEWRLKLIAHLMSLPSPIKDGSVQLHGMGDEAAVDITKVLTTKKSLTSSELEAILDIVHMAFEQLPSVIEPLNRKPLGALALLGQLNSTNEDPLLKQRIRAETAFLKGVEQQANAMPSGK